ncbi:YhgE/Pip domain-containing protein [Kurthia massiliensis]|uniref:YhgE/Pip domain-containing protein n=1 Tax=Kurthia massiliensis TaxID=1033739 RepID=UPI0002885F95|nr:ABC transporter permease [Kurthia massiliensis]
MTFKQFFKSQGVIASVFMGVFYAVSMLGIFLAGYSALPGNMDQLRIALVNDDKGQAAKDIEKNLTKQLPFEIEQDVTYKTAQKGLEKNDYALVIHIPKDFTKNAQAGESANIDFSVNEASATMVSSSMNTIVKQINEQLSSNFSTQTAQGILMNMNVPEKQAAEMAKQIENSYVGNYVIINDVPDGMHHNMLPMFLTMACYVGAMIAAMQLVSAFRQFHGQASKTKLFIYVQLCALIVALLGTIAGLILVFTITEADTAQMFKVAAQQILLYMVAFNFCAIFTFLVGDGGMVLNIPVLLAQTIANGATMPRDMMYKPFEVISYITPMYHSVQSYLAIFYGSISPEPFLWGLAAVGVGALIINILIVAFVHKPVPLNIVENLGNPEDAKQMIA